MAKHVYYLNKDGGYFYRMFPKLAQLRFSPTKEKSVQADLFNPLPVFDSHYTVDAIYGKFIQKYDDKGLTIELLQKGEFTILCLFTRTMEQRTLQSKVLIIVPKEVYNYPFERNKIYSLSLYEVKDITP